MKLPGMSFYLVLASVVSTAACSQSFAQSGSLQSETPIAASAPTAVPSLVPYSGAGVGGSGKALAGDVAITFLIYKDEQGGESLWTETQTVAIDPTGHYKVQLGAANPNGLPANLFSSGEARWLEVQIAGEAAQQRVLIASVPYALKAGDATTLGGLPASAYALAASKSGATAAAQVSAGAVPDTSATVTTTGGTTGYVPIFTGASAIADSVLFQNAKGIGINTTDPNAALDIHGSEIVRGPLYMARTGNASPSTAFNSNPFVLFAQAWDTAIKGPVGPSFQWQAEPSRNNTPSPGATLNLLFGNGLAGPVETGFYLKPNGTINFAAGQTFPGTGAGTITGVTAGTGLTGGGTSGTVTLNLDTTKVPLLGTANSFTGNQSVVGSVTANDSSAATNAAGITGNESSATGLVSGVIGNARSTTSGAAGVSGNESAATGLVYGVLGTANSNTPSSAGVQGVENATTGQVFGVNGTSASSGANSAGVGGYAMSKTGSVAGVNGYAISTTNGASGISGYEGAATGQVTGVGGGTASSTNGAAGVTAYEGSATGQVYGVTAGTASSTDGAAGVFGYENATTGAVYGVSGSTSSTGINSAGLIGREGASTGQVYGVSGITNSAGNFAAGVGGYEGSPTGYVYGVIGDAISTTGGAVGVLGNEEAVTGQVYGVIGDAYSTTNGAVGVQGYESAATGQVYGVNGLTDSTSDGAAGVNGTARGVSGNNFGVQGTTASSSGTGVSGNATSTTGNTMGVQGVSASSGSGAVGVNGVASATSGNTTGVQGVSLSSTGTGVLGTNTSGLGGNGVIGIAITTGAYSAGVQGIAGPGGTGVNAVSPNIGVAGYAEAQCGPPYECPLTSGTGGVFAAGAGGLILSGQTGPTNIDTHEVFHVDARGNGYFAGNLNVTGKVVKGSGSFKIDDPLDPANKYLSHSFVESPDMMNVYNGNVKTDKSGRATVELPEYFESLNSDFRYQLTVMGQFAQAIVDQKVGATRIGHNRFVIRTSKPSVEVSWQVTGIRKDAYAAANRIPVEEEKPADERGYYLHPEVFNQPPSKGIVAAHQTEAPSKSVAQLTVARKP